MVEKKKFGPQPWTPWFVWGTTTETGMCPNPHAVLSYSHLYSPEEAINRVNLDWLLVAARIQTSVYIGVESSSAQPSHVNSVFGGVFFPRFFS